MRMRNFSLPLVALVVGTVSGWAQSSKPVITLDEFLNTTEIRATRLAPDGSSAVIATSEPDWKAGLFREQLWIWNAASGLRSLTHSGSETEPQWSPDGKSIAFLSDRALPGEEATESGSAKDSTSRVWIISASGGEALPLYTAKLDAHSFAWSADGATIFLATTQPLNHDEQEELKAQWKDVIRYREAQRGDVLLSFGVDAALKKALATPAPNGKEKDEKLPAEAHIVAESTCAIEELAPSPDGRQIAFITGPTHHRIERPSDYEIYLVPSAGGSVRQLTRNNASESSLHWAADSRALYFSVRAAGGALEGPYRDIEGRLYRIEVNGNQVVERLGASFTGSFDSFTLTASGRLLALGQVGTEVQVYFVEGQSATPLRGVAGSYSHIEAARSGSTLLLTHSSVTEPTQAFVASDVAHLAEARAITGFNPIFHDRALPEGVPYTWKSDDGSSVEGMLIYPPGRKGEKHLRTLVLIHGGPADADGNRFGANWYDWATLAAARGWLVFRPNYRGSTGYGDSFMLGIEKHLVSVPGRDILTGVDALVRDGIADGDHLAVGGYSYGGYMTNWLITQSSRFRSAVTGAGAVEHAANWGNDDMTSDDAWYLGGRPWENAQLYTDEGALFHFDKVKTPTHLVQGNADIRVAYLEGVTMERALDSLGVPHSFLVFPGEGHGLGKNPWHGYIKVREELKWLEKYDNGKAQ